MGVGEITGLSMRAYSHSYQANRIEGAQGSVQLEIWDRAKDVTLDQRAFAGWCKEHRPASSSRGLCLF